VINVEHDVVGVIRFYIDDFFKFLDILFCFSCKDEVSHAHFKCEADLEDIHQGLVIKDTGDK
jgi:hypothetical protein